RIREIEDHFRVPVDENADGLGGGSEFAANVPSVSGRNGAWRFFVKIEAEGPGAEFFGEAGVLRAGDAADFDEGGHRVRVLLLRRGTWSLRCGHSHIFL